MLPDDPRHGSNAGYVAHYRAGEKPCEPCRTERARSQKRARIDAARGNPRTITATEVGQHVTGLRNDGMPYSEIARRANVSEGTVRRSEIPGTNIHRRNAARILKVTPTDEAHSGYVPRTGPARRIRALIAIGYTPTNLAHRLGITQNNLSNFIHDGNSCGTRRLEWVQAATANKIREVYDQLSMTPGPSKSAKRRAKEHGWAPPLAWDDIDTDTQPRNTKTIPARHRRRDAFVENVEWITDAGDNLTVAAARLDMTWESLRDQLRRAGRLDLYWRLAGREPNAQNRHATATGIQRVGAA